MLRLLLLRHSKTIPFAGSGDRERYLTERGQKDATRLGAFLAAEKIVPRLAIHSTARRSKETLDLVLAKLPGDVERALEPRLYEATPSIFLHLVQDSPDEAESVMVVGHNPAIGEMARRFAGDGDPAALMKMAGKFPTSALAILDFESDHWRDVEEGDGRLERFVTPADLGARDD